MNEVTWPVIRYRKALELLTKHDCSCCDASQVAKKALMGPEFAPKDSPGLQPSECSQGTSESGTGPTLWCEDCPTPITCRDIGGCGDPSF